MIEKQGRMHGTFAVGTRVGVAWLMNRRGCEYCPFRRGKSLRQSDVTRLPPWMGGYPNISLRLRILSMRFRRFPDEQPRRYFVQEIIGFRSLRLSGVKAGARLAFMASVQRRTWRFK